MFYVSLIIRPANEPKRKGGEIFFLYSVLTHFFLNAIYDWKLRDFKCLTSGLRIIQENLPFALRSNLHLLFVTTFCPRRLTCRDFCWVLAQREPREARKRSLVGVQKSLFPWLPLNEVVPGWLCPWTEVTCSLPLFPLQLLVTSPLSWPFRPRNGDNPTVSRFLHYCHNFPSLILIFMIISL